MHRTRSAPGRLLQGLLGLTLALAATPAAAAGERWPLWPTEVQRAAEPLQLGQGRSLAVVPETHKLQALRTLERYPTALVAPILLEALVDPTASVRRDALYACLERTLLACIPAALLEWRNDRSAPGVRVAALRVLALDAATTPGRPDLLLAALREPDESMRAEAVYTLARVAWPDDLMPRVRTALIARLADQAPPVRRAAARSLGLLGPSGATAGSATGNVAGRSAPSEPAQPRLLDPAPLALARLLADPDPQVRQDAAEALGNLRDPRAAAPLLRVIEAGDEAFVSRSLVLALAALPGPDVDAALLRLLDAPPRGLTHRNISEALGRRYTPGPALIEGLIARLREEVLQGFVLEILLHMGEAAGPALRAARARGLEPQLALPVERLLTALEPPGRAVSLTPTWPARSDRDTWHLRLADPAGALIAALALAEDPPPWLPLAAVGALAREFGATQRRPWLLALAAAPHVLLPADDAVTHARLAGWAADAGQPVLDRCLALAALGRAHAPDRAGLASDALTAAASDPRPAVRACAAAITTDDALLAALLLDESPRVRAVVAFHVAACPLRPALATQSLIARLAAEDPHSGVVRAATAALAHLRAPSPEPCGIGLLDLGEARAGPALELAGWVDLDWRGQDLRLPVEVLGERRYLLLPGLDGAVPRTQEPLPPRPEPR